MPDPCDTAPIPVTDKDYDYPLWWEDLHYGDVVLDRQGEVCQVISGITKDARDCFVQMYKYHDGEWEKCTGHRYMREEVRLMGVHEWSAVR
jgi:hypothetical protein